MHSMPEASSIPIESAPVNLLGGSLIAGSHPLPGALSRTQCAAACKVTPSCQGAVWNCANECYLKSGSPRLARSFEACTWSWLPQSRWPECRGTLHGYLCCRRSSWTSWDACAAEASTRSCLQTGGKPPCEMRMPTQAMMYANALSADAANVPPLANLPLPSRELLKERFYRFYVCNRPRPPGSCLDAVTSTPGCGEPFWACGSCPRDSSPLILPAIARNELDCQKAPNEPLCRACLKQQQTAASRTSPHASLYPIRCVGMCDKVEAKARAYYYTITAARHGYGSHQPLNRSHHTYLCRSCGWFITRPLPLHPYPYSRRHVWRYSSARAAVDAVGAVIAV